MAKYTKDEIVERAKELARMIAETEEVDFFKRAEAQINENEKVSATITTIKGLQKQAVNLQHYGKAEALKKTEEKIAQLEQQLDEIPVVQEFKQSQVDVNELLQIVANTISNTVTDEVITSTGGNLLSGETGSKISNSSCTH
ncbi:RicAFT regulatory complex protein RicA family protein [Bacillus sp. CMF12]|uniref:RicAFT regulatory complex protein RicA family protein n=1 Tax=Bacillaceae TaxID=186817 RepID=UPI001FB238CA|nr:MULTISPECIES: RicAFT regulatory complex protein RicA family protein [Bacillaceae]MDF2039797.1 RicAFT regulatory complex protein RicA family protein [Cytobacillus oceanisediminis]MDM5226133.1 RicAFT regulatory complex protein RicA family protein [Cytobacillus sp. NJ13]UOE57236.1 RicAFT regulatory complex protein RicA family protein [Cytobacillus oceanisediminis]USK51729.1 RicAFT regulatory complex protein RicA family protein [Bacillus sp. CMF12]